ncbi:REDY-like protein HapK [Sandaracinobacteroides hominis]|uniref:REDY-like protein HapK n=1 Tax=Sandaracinobacteroides hominis TaxID=2780086 RepID=UPI0018F64F52|nr:REDY-like protein HapK [Sandaracinobacteroides hominis]
MRLIALFNLKPGVSVADYEKWAREVDLPTVNGLGSVSAFEVFRATGVLGSDAPSPYAYVEIIDVADMDQFGADVAGEAMQKIAAQFQGMADVTFLTTEKL